MYNLCLFKVSSMLFFCISIVLGLGNDIQSMLRHENNEIRCIGFMRGSVLEQGEETNVAQSKCTDEAVLLFNHTGAQDFFYTLGERSIELI